MITVNQNEPKPAICGLQMLQQKWQCLVRIAGHKFNIGEMRFQLLPKRAAGYLMKKELDFLGEAVDKPKRPFVAIIGGAKVSGKIDVIEALLPKVDTLVIGGGMAFTFYKAQGKEIGGSLVEDDRVEMAKALLAKAGGKLVLPVDTVVTDSFDFDARKVGTLKTVSWDAIGAMDIGVDIGEKTRAKFAEIVKGAKTVVWNGPMGVFEKPQFAAGTNAVAQAVVDATQKSGAVTVIGGGAGTAGRAHAGPPWDPAGGGPRPVQCHPRRGRRRRTRPRERQGRRDHHRAPGGKIGAGEEVRLAAARGLD